MKVIQLTDQQAEALTVTIQNEIGNLHLRTAVELLPAIDERRLASIYEVLQILRDAG